MNRKKPAEDTYLVQALRAAVARKYSGSDTDVGGALDNAETTKMSNEEIRRTGAAKRPPGTKPGGPLTQRRRIRLFNRLEIREVEHFSVMFGMVAIAFGLGSWCAYRNLVEHPETFLDKSRRESIPELEDPDGQRRWGEWFPAHSMLRKLLHRGAGRAVAEEVFYEPPFLPGDERPALGLPRVEPYAKPFGGGY